MRIAQVCYGLNIGGVQRIAVDLASAIAAEGHSSFYVHRVDGPMRTHLDPRVEVIRCGDGTLSYRRPLQLWEATKSLVELARRHRWDVIHAWDVMSWMVSAAAGAVTHIPVVRTQPNFIRKYERLNARTLHVLPFMKWTAMFHALQEATGQDLIAAGVPASKVFVELGLIRLRQHASREQTRGRLGVDADTPVVISVGRLVDGKGWELIPGIAARVAAENPAVKFWVVGDGPLYAQILRLIDEASVGDVVQMLGEQVAVEDFYAASDVGLFPVASHAGMADASAFVPMVAGDGPCQREYLSSSGAGLLCEDNERGYAAGVNRLLADDSLRRELAAAGRADFENRLSIARGVKRLISMYSRLTQ